MSSGMSKPVFHRFTGVMQERPAQDLHIHTTITDGSSTLEEYVKRAIELNLQEIAFTEHVRRSSSWFPSFVEQVELLQESYRNTIQIYHGIEAKILDLDGHLDATDEMLDTAQIILGSVHRFPQFCMKGYGNMHEIPRDEFARIEFSLSEAIITKSEADVLAHPGGMYARKFRVPFPERYQETLIALANKYDTAIEINSSYLQEVSFNCALFYRLNPCISLGSDAHKKDELGTVIRFISTIQQQV